MRHLQRISFLNHDAIVVPHSGKYPLSDSHCLMLGDAVQLLEEASELLADYGNMMGFGREYQKVAEWHRMCKAFADARAKHHRTGLDYLGGYACG